MKANRQNCFRQVLLTALVVASANLVAQEPDAPSQGATATTASAGPVAGNLSFQYEAMAKYPELGRAGSPFNLEFLARVRRLVVSNLAFFDDARWPLVLATEIAASGFPTGARASTPNAPAPLSGGSQASSQIQLLGRTAIPPSEAPPVVLRAVEAGNTLQTKTYKWGGGRARLEDSGYDCSGSVSYVLIKSGLLDEPRTSRTFASYGEPGPGRWITIFAGPGHVFMSVCGLRLDTGGRGGFGEKGPRWSPWPRPANGYVMRHPPSF